MGYKKLVIFDLDGTLLDSKLDFMAIRDALGVPENIGILEYIEQQPKKEKERLFYELLCIELTSARQASLYPHVKEMLDLLSAKGYFLAIFTRNSKEAAKIAVQKFSLPIDVIVAREDAEPKPSPEGLRLICQKLKVKESEALYIGDYVYDLNAGEAAQIDTWLYISTKDQLPDFASKAERIIFSFSEICEILNIS